MNSAVQKFKDSLENKVRLISQTGEEGKKRGREEMREIAYMLLPPKTQNLILKTIPYSL